LKIIPRLKTVSKIARLIDHQKEVIELQVQETTNRIGLEKGKLTVMEKALQDTIDGFEQRHLQQAVLTSDEVGHLFESASNCFFNMERKKKKIVEIEKELEVQWALFLEAFKKKKAITIVQNKLVLQERREEAVLEQKNMDFLNLLSRSRK